MNLEMTKTYLARAIKLVGKRRFTRIFNVYCKLQSPDGELLHYKYDTTHTTDCFEMMIFSDRLQNNGYYRNSPRAVAYFMDHFVDLMVSAHKHNLIKKN